jgi:hypothetical protein
MDSSDMGKIGGKAKSQRKVEAARRNWLKALETIRKKRENKVLTDTKRLVESTQAEQ